MIGYSCKDTYPTNFILFKTSQARVIGKSMSSVRFDQHFKVSSQNNITKIEYLKQLGDVKLELAKEIDIITFRSPLEKQLHFHQAKWLFDYCTN